MIFCLFDVFIIVLDEKTNNHIFIRFYDTDILVDIIWLDIAISSWQNVQKKKSFHIPFIYMQHTACGIGWSYITVRHFKIILNHCIVFYVRVCNFWYEIFSHFGINSVSSFNPSNFNGLGFRLSLHFFYFYFFLFLFNSQFIFKYVHTIIQAISSWS